MEALKAFATNPYYASKSAQALKKEGLVNKELIHSIYENL